MLKPGGEAPAAEVERVEPNEQIPDVEFGMEALAALAAGGPDVLADALRHLQPGIRPDEEGLLQVFDSHRDQICAAATKVYKRGNRGSYDLGPTDF